MFDKEKFAEILSKINETYDTMTEFATKSGVNRTYLSQYINKKLYNPPTPKILEKIADASNGISSYYELMDVCGYLITTEERKFANLKTQAEYIEFRKYILEENNFTPSEIKKLKEISEIENINEYKFNLNKFLSKLPDNKKKIAFDLIKDSMHYIKSLHLSYLNKNKKDQFFNIPILGKIAAGQPILADEYLEGYLPVDPNIYGMTTPDDYFYLKVSGESMNLKIHNGDYALIHKQDYAENGDIVVAIVNGDDEATLKRYKKLTDEMVMLEPMSTYPMEPLVINLKETKFQIVGKAIGQFGKF